MKCDCPDEHCAQSDYLRSIRRAVPPFDAAKMAATPTIVATIATATIGRDLNHPCNTEGSIIHSHAAQINPTVT